MTVFDGKYPSEQHDLHVRKPIRRWDEALPLGNGLTGCLVWGDGAPLRFSLDRGDLWDTRPAPEVLDDGFTYRNMIELVRRGAQEELSRRFSDFFSVCPHPTKLPAGRLELHGGSPAERMECRLNVRAAKAEIEWRAGEQTCRLESFLHAETGLGYIRLQGTSASRAELKLVAPDYTGHYEDREDPRSAFDISLASLGYPGADFGSDDNVTWFLQPTNHGLEYAIVVAEQQRSELETEWVYAIAANRDGMGWLEQAKRKTEDALHAGFDEALRTHTGWWEQYWRQSAITLPDFDMEKMWYLTNYLFGSCSRKGAPPMPLQGVWTADEGLLPPWKGDYHHDLNTELCYWHYLKANHLQEGESFLDFLWDLRPAAREFARTFYEAPGINLPSVMTIEGKPLGGWPMYSLSPTNQIWVCQAFDHYWLYTGDRDFLETRAYVYLQESAACVLHLLIPGEDGKLRLPVSSSPEIHDDRLEAWLTPNSNYDLSLLRYLFARLENMAELLGKHQEREMWADVLARLPELAFDDSGFMVSPDEALTESHRHFSHAMAIYPLQTVQYHRSDREKQIIDDTILHLERLGKGYWCGYSFSWMAALYTRQGNGEAARHHLRLLWEFMCSPNGFHLNGDYKKAGITQFHYRPFTLEGNMAAADALQEMLLQTNGGMIRLFPAIPDDWAAGTAAFQRLRGEGGVLVSAVMTSGELERVELHAERDGTFRLENRFNSSSVALETNGVTSIIDCPVGSALSIALRKGEVCRLHPDPEGREIAIRTPLP